MILNYNKFKTLNKKADERISLMTLIEIALIVMIVIFAITRVSSIADKKDLTAAHYSMYYSFFTSQLEGSPGDIILISPGNEDYDLSFDEKTLNLVGVTYLSKDSLPKISAYPYLKISNNNIYRKSNLNENVYFIKYGDKTLISNFNSK